MAEQTTTLTPSQEKEIKRAADKAALIAEENDAKVKTAAHNKTLIK